MCVTISAYVQKLNEPLMISIYKKKQKKYLSKIFFFPVNFLFFPFSCDCLPQGFGISVDNTYSLAILKIYIMNRVKMYYLSHSVYSALCGQNRIK